MNFGEIGSSLCRLVKLVKLIVDIPKEQAAFADTGITDHNDLSQCCLLSHYDILYF